MPVTFLGETPSQTAGPYVHIGLIPRQAGFDIFAQDFSNTLVGPETKGERIRIEGCIFEELRNGFGHPLAEVVVGHRCSGAADDGEARRNTALVEEAI